MRSWLLVAALSAAALVWAWHSPIALMTISQPSTKVVKKPDDVEAVAHWAKRLQQRFGDMSALPVQLALYQFRRQQINRMVPVAVLDAAIQQAFPQHFAALVSLFSRLDQYQAWLLEQQKTLLALPEWQREARLWQQRHALFGEQARQIWQQDVAQYEQQRLALQAGLERLQNSQQGLPQLALELQQLVQQHVANESALAATAVASVFFSLDSVQQQLRQLPAEQRQQAIDRARQQLGISAERRQWLAQRDQKRQQRWQRGLDYMQQRRELKQRYEGQAFEQALAQLQQKIFAHEADTIAREEEQGFFRYQRPRLYGRN
jgi:hypothetical protein